ncbi:hypothetical protein K1T71_004808 [Dendrolimus kikuchii]|uniref:Uncharacterized protein n=1 Tax=Dendrolimus kikuchii TaxID=765133 RepID=A0ACC1D5G1_9NEOP|nr:hypothetical protein K1T71_004808 [Dendrolimus kikuchii]
MNYLKILRSTLKVAGTAYQPNFNCTAKRFKRSSRCDISLLPSDKKPCFDLKNVLIERGNPCHAKLIRSFLYTHYWPREPSVVGLWMAMDCPYLDILTDKYSHSGDRFLAFEIIPRTGERKLIGVLVANKIWPWMIDELEEWAHYTTSKPERHRMYFTAHCYKSPNYFNKYRLDYIYDVEILGTSADVTGQSVGKLLLRTALEHAKELRYPLVQVVAVSQYAAKICEKCGMKRDWTMNYADFVNDVGHRVFFPRRPHQTVAIYTKYNDPKKGGELPCKPSY